jgi:hypothetical protein
MIAMSMSLAARQGRGNPFAAYAIGGQTPQTIADFEADKYRADGTTSTAASLLTHTRTGNAVQVADDGTLQWAGHNLITYSEDFTDASWTKINGGTATAPLVTANFATSPDGTTNASRVVANLSGGTTGADYSLVRKNVTLAVTEGNSTYSIWVKSNTGADQTITLSYIGSPLTITATSEWQKFSVAPNVVGTTNQCDIGLRGDTTDQTCDVLIWGAHLYRSDLGGMADIPTSYRGLSSSSTYLPTTSAARYLPRVDNHIWNGSAWLKRCLVEPQSTNLVTYSEDFTDPSWSQTVDGLLVTANSENAPTGEATADTLTEKATTSFHAIHTITNAVSANWTASIFIKQKTAGRYLQIRPFGVGVGVAYATFSPSDGSVYESGGTNLVSTEAESFGNGWYRVSLTCSSALASGDGIQFSLSDGTSGEAPSYTGDGTSGIYIWGAQVEASSVPTSYIPTAGAQVTRPADALSIDSTLLPYDSTAMTIGLDGEMTYADNNDPDEVIFCTWALDSLNFISSRVRTNLGTGQMQFRQRESGTTDAVQSAVSYFSPGTNVPFNIASRHTSSDINGAADGTALTANTTPTALPDLSATDFEIAPTGVINIKSLRILGGYGATDAELEAATT